MKLSSSVSLTLEDAIRDDHVKLSPITTKLLQYNLITSLTRLQLFKMTT